MKTTCLERFKLRVKITPTCWEWTGMQDKDCYGLLTVENQSRRAHRLAYELFVSEIPQGMCVLHRCDNPPCVNPKHLFLGTVADNNEDKRLKKRQTFGANVNTAKLTESQVKEIRVLRQSGQHLKPIAKLYRVTHQLISQICRKECWKSV